MPPVPTRAPRLWLTLFVASASLPPILLCAHDTFFRVAEYWVEPGDAVEVTVLHGTFDESVVQIDTNHVERLFLSGPQGEQEIGTGGWVEEGFGRRVWGKWQLLRAWAGSIDKRMTSRFVVTPPEEGSYMVAMSLHPAGAALPPAVFNKYLGEQGLQDTPVSRHGITDPNAIITERWRKYVKLLLQAGDALTANVTEPCGLVVELVPLSHPASAKPGTTLDFQLFWRGAPLPEQPVIVGRPRPRFDAAPAHRRLVSDAEGRIHLPIDDEGVWWLSFVHLVPAPPGDEVAWESFWATLTFSIP